MIRPTTLSYPSAVAVLCGLLCGLRFASAVVAKPKNVSSLPEVTAGHSIRGDRVDTIAPPDSRASPSTDRLASKGKYRKLGRHFSRFISFSDNNMDHILYRLIL